MKKGQIYEGVIEYVDFPNKSSITVIEQDSDGEKREIKVAVKGGIPGQKVSFIVNKVRRDKCQGRIKEVLKRSPLETAEPVCAKFGVCGGCNYQTLPYEEQLKLKKSQVLKLIDEVYCPGCHCRDGEENCFIGQDISHKENIVRELDADSGQKGYVYDGILPSPQMIGYRNKMEFSFGDEIKGGPLTLGLHKKGSFHDIIDADCCKIVHEDFTKILTCVRSYCQQNKIPHYKKNSHEGVLRHLLVRRADATGEILAALVVSSQQLHNHASIDLQVGDLSGQDSDVQAVDGETIDWSPLAERLKALPLEGKLVGFLLITNDSLGDVVQSDKTEILFGKDFFTEEVLGLKFKISPFSFFQTNTRGAEVLYQRARDYILGNVPNADTNKKIDLRDKVVFDLYSGTGTIAQIIAPIAKKVIGVEIVEEAVEAAKENAKQNGLTNCEFIAGDVLKVLDEIEEKPDFIILDPPRDGIHPKALRKILSYGVGNMVYISCKPTSFVRDLIVFQEYGYEIKRVSNVDMFPGTAHVETVVQLVNIGAKPDYTVRLEVDVDEFYKTVGEEKRHFVKPDQNNKKDK